MFCTIHGFTFLMTHKDLGQVSFESFACMIFGKIYYFACAINHTDKFICLRACLHECNCVGLIDRPITDLHKILQKFIFY